MNVIYELQPATNEITYLAHLSLLYICIRMNKIYLFIYMIPLTGTRLNLQFHLLHHYFFLGPNNLSNFLLDSISLLMLSSFSAALSLSFLVLKQVLCIVDHKTLNGILSSFLTQNYYFKEVIIYKASSSLSSSLSLLSSVK